MKKSRILTTSLLLCALVLYGCDEGLDLGPTGSVTTDDYWQRDTDALTAVNAAYGQLDGPGMIKQLDAVTDIGYRAGSGPGTLHDVNAGNIVPSNTAITNFWNQYYTGVRRANDVITNIDQIEVGDEALMERVEAEARFLRAYFYTQLTSLWGDVPLILEPLEINEHVGRTDREEIVDFIIAELDDIIASESLPPSYSGSDVGRATHGAAQALKARVALRNERWEVARDAAWDVIQSGVYSLYPNYGELFQYAGQNSEEIIFDRQYHPDGQTYNAFAYSASSIGGSSITEPLHNFYLLMEFDGPQNPDDPYENIDPRWDFTVYYTGQPIGTSTYNSRPDSPTNDRVNSTETTTQHGYNLKKWVDFENDRSNPGNGSINMILIRYADVLLMYAEAKIELDEIDDTVYEAINQVRQRPTVDMPPLEEPMTQEELRERVRNERGVELAFEGLRLYDMNRWRIGERKATENALGAHFQDEDGEWYLQSIGFRRTFNPDRDYLWPIPQFEMNANSAITQNNPGYN